MIYWLEEFTYLFQSSDERIYVANKSSVAKAGNARVLVLKIPFFPFLFEVHSMKKKWKDKNAKKTDTGI